MGRFLTVFYKTLNCIVFPFQELMLPIMETGNLILSLIYWDDPMESIVFCLLSTFIIWRGWLVYVFALASLFSAIFMVLTRFFSREKLMIELKVTAPPPMSTMEQLLAVQNGISQLEQNIQDGNIVLLKFRALLFSLFPQVCMPSYT